MIEISHHLKEQIEDLLNDAKFKIELDFENAHDRSNVICSWEESSYKKCNDDWQARFDKILEQLRAAPVTEMKVPGME